MKSTHLDSIITELERYIEAAERLKGHMQQVGDEDQAESYRRLGYDCFDALTLLKVGRRFFEAGAITLEQRNEVRRGILIGDLGELPEAAPQSPAYMGPPSDEDEVWADDHEILWQHELLHADHREPPDDQDYWRGFYELAVDLVFGANYSLPKLDDDKGWEEFHAVDQSA